MDLPTHLLLFFSCIILSVDCLMFNLEPNNRKCLKEEIHKGVLVTGEYEVRHKFRRYSNYITFHVLRTGRWIRSILKRIRIKLLGVSRI